MAMASPPKRSFKRTVASTVEERSPRFLLGSLALAMVISLVAGLGIGIAVGENDDDTAKPKAGITPTTKPTTRRPAKTTFAPPPLSATVVRVGPRLLVVSKGERRIAMTMPPSVRVNVVRPATRSEIKKGARVLFDAATLASTPTTSGDAATDKTTTSRSGPKVPAYSAKAILIVSGKAANRIGSTITAVTSETMTFLLKGKPVTISTVGATVEKTVSAGRAKLFAGRPVLVKSKLLPAAKPAKKTAAKAPRRRVVIEIIALPSGSPFG